MKEKIKRFGWFMTGFLLMMGTHVIAGTITHSAVVTDNYHEVYYKEPYYVEVCGEQNQSNVISSALWGGIFGAIVGDAIDDESGRVPGAVIGALIGAEEGQNQGGTRIVCQTVQRQTSTSHKAYSHSTIRFDYEGKFYEIDFIKR